MTTTARAARRAAAAALLATRLPILIVGALAVTTVGTIPPPAAEALWRVSADELTNLFARWDTAFYYSIATEGYRWDPSVFRHQNVVFFPLYPWLMRWGGWLVGGHPLLAGVTISFVAFGGAVVLLYRLAALEMGDALAGPAVVLLVTFPYALFFSVVYTESLFLLVTVGAFYALRRGRLVAAAVWGLAAGLVRPNGWWLALPLLLLARQAASDPASDRRIAGSRRTLAFVAACAPLAGAAIFSVYLQARFGDALAWVHGQAAWGVPLLGRLPAPDPVRLAWESRIKITEAIVWAGNIGAFVMAACAIRPVTRRLGAAYGVWIAANIFPPVAAHLFISLGRFTSILFPMFFWLALRVPPTRIRLLAGVFAAGQIVLAAWFFLWRPVV